MGHENAFERIVFLSDAVVAIAATLLVLPLVDVAGELDDQTVSHLLAENGDKLFVFALSFAVIARLWMVHHAIFDQIDGFRPPLIWANFVWLFAIAFLPFPTELVGVGQSAQAAPLYIGTLCVAAVAAGAQQWIIVRNPSIQRSEVRGTITVDAAVVAAGLLLVALALAVFVPQVGMWALALLFLSGLVEAILRRRRSPEPKAIGGDR